MNIGKNEYAVLKFVSEKVNIENRNTFNQILTLTPNAKIKLCQALASLQHKQLLYAEWKPINTKTGFKPKFVKVFSLTPLGSKEYHKRQHRQQQSKPEPMNTKQTLTTTYQKIVFNDPIAKAYYDMALQDGDSEVNAIQGARRLCGENSILFA